jgi:hypothetical protein
MESRYEVIEHAGFPGQWHVEYISSTSGECFVAIFTGPEAEQRAREYAAWNGDAVTGNQSQTRFPLRVVGSFEHQRFFRRSSSRIKSHHGRIDQLPTLRDVSLKHGVHIAIAEHFH